MVLRNNCFIDSELNFLNLFACHFRVLLELKHHASVMNQIKRILFIQYCLLLYVCGKKPAIQSPIGPISPKKNNNKPSLEQK